jgi:hypothetical protein
MTKDDFLSNLPETISHHGYGESNLIIVDDNPYRKTACYINEKKLQIGYRCSNTWANLYNEMILYLKGEGYIK